MGRRQWQRLVARCFRRAPRAGLADQRRSPAGGRSFGPHCSKHFPLDVGFLLCLAATQGCLNFSQRQIFIHQSVQCSTGQAWEGEGETSVPSGQKGCVSPAAPVAPPLQRVTCEVGPSWRSQERGLPVLLSHTHPGTTRGCAFRREGALTLLPAPLISLGKFTVNIFPGTLSSFWQSPSVCRTVKSSPRSKLWEICFYSNP